MIELNYGYSHITDRFVERYPDLETFKDLINGVIEEHFSEDGKLDFGVELAEEDWKVLYGTLRRLFKNHWFKSTDGELRDLRFANKFYLEVPRLKFERAIEERLITDGDLDSLLKSRTIQNSAQHPGTPPPLDADDVLGYTDAQTVLTQKQSVADLVNTTFLNRSSRLERFCKSFDDMFVDIFSMAAVPYFTGSEEISDEEVN